MGGGKSKGVVADQKSKLTAFKESREKSLEFIDDQKHYFTLSFLRNNVSHVVAMIILILIHAALVSILIKLKF